MRAVRLYEYKDLELNIQRSVLHEVIGKIVDERLQNLTLAREDGVITNEEFFRDLGCSEFYAETSWFVPSSCYYEEHKSVINNDASSIVKNGLYNIYGLYVMENPLNKE